MSDYKSDPVLGSVGYIHEMKAAEFYGNKTAVTKWQGSLQSYGGPKAAVVCRKDSAMQTTKVSEQPVFSEIHKGNQVMKAPANINALTFYRPKEAFLFQVCYLETVYI